MIRNATATAIFVRTEAVAESNYSNGEWHTLSCEYNVPLNFAVIYYDGVSQPLIYCNKVQPIFTNFTGSFHIGGAASTPGKVTGYDFNGEIDEVRIYNRSLSGAEHLSLYNNGTAGVLTDVTTDLFAYWNMNSTL